MHGLERVSRLWPWTDDVAVEWVRRGETDAVGVEWVRRGETVEPKRVERLVLDPSARGFASDRTSAARCTGWWGR